MNLYSYLLYLYQTKIQDAGNIVPKGYEFYDNFYDFFKGHESFFVYLGILIAVLAIIDFYIDNNPIWFKFAIFGIISTLFGALLTVRFIPETKGYKIAKVRAIKDSIDYGTKEIKKQYNQNVVLFDNYKTDDIEEIIKKVKEKEKLYNQEIENTMGKMKELMIKKDIFIEDDKIKPFVELYVMSENKIPIFNKIEQKLSPEETGKVCKALNIENCFENSSFVEYNKAKKEREEKLARMSRSTNSTTGFLMYPLLR